MKYILLLGAICFSSLSYATLDCNYHFQLSNAVIEVADSSQVIQKSFTINRGQNSPSGRCELWRLFFSKGLANNYQRRAYSLWGASLTYNLHKNVNQSGVLKDFGDAVTANEFLDGQAPSRNTTYTYNYFISVPGLNNTSVPSGIYYDVVQARIYGYNQSSGNYLFDDADNLTLVFYVSKSIQLSLIDEGGTFDAGSTSKVMDFGNLSQNQERGVDLRVVSNGSYQIKLSSQNNGYLKLSQGETIAYSLRVNNSNISLSGSSSGPVLIGSGDSTTSSGDRYNLKVKIIENTGNKSAGMYQDVVTITAIAN